MPELQFPYMAWALTRSFLSPWCLAQSGMPAPAEGFLEGLSVDLSFATAEAQPALEKRLAQLYGVEPERVLVTPGGEPAQVRLLRSAGSPRLDRAAIAAVEQWRFAPAREGDEAVASWVQVPIAFTLE